MGQVHGIIKIILCRLVLLLLPSSIIILAISLLILLLSIHHLNLILRCYTFLIESYDLISKSLLIIIAQKNVEYKKTLGLNIIILLIRLIITFRTVRIIIFYFFLNDH